MRRFEKISLEEFSKNFGENLGLYDDFLLPERKTTIAAGYDFYLLEDLRLEPNEIKKIATGVKAKFAADEVLFLVVRSSIGFKYNIRLVNQVGIVDSDYYNNPDNEGQIFYKVQNESDTVWEFKKGDRLIQGIFLKYLTVNDESIIKDDQKQRRSDK